MEAAKTYGLDHADSMTAQDIKKAVIAKTSAVNLDGKSEAYIDAAYDMALADGAKRADAMEKQKKAMNQPDGKPQGKEDMYDVDGALASLRKDEADAYMKEVK